MGTEYTFYSVSMFLLDYNQMNQALSAFTLLLLL